MSFNPPPSPSGGTSMNPSTTLGDSSSGPQHDLTAGDIAVIVGAVVVFTLIVFSVFYYRARRKQAAELMEMEDNVGEDHEETGKQDKKVAPIWRFLPWKEKEKGAKEVGTRGSTAMDVRGDTQPTNETGAYHAV